MALPLAILTAAAVLVSYGSADYTNVLPCAIAAACLGHELAALLSLLSVVGDAELVVATLRDLAHGTHSVVKAAGPTMMLGHEGAPSASLAPTDRVDAVPKVCVDMYGRVCGHVCGHVYGHACQTAFLHVRCAVGRSPSD